MKTRFEADFRSARHAVLTSVADANGWRLKEHDRETVTDAPCFVYLVEPRTEWVWLAQTAHSSFMQVAVRASTFSDDDKQDCVDSLSWLVKAAAEKPLTTESETNLAICTAAYIGTTRTFAVGREVRHFVVMYYPDRRGSGRLRPFAVPSPTTYPIAVDDLKIACKRVLSLDRANHPEWFIG